MDSFAAFDPRSEVSGAALLSFFYSLTSESIMPYLEYHGLADINPDGWYPVQAALDALHDIAVNDPSAMFDFVGIGIAAADYMRLPDHYDDLDPAQALEHFNEVHRLNHRGGSVGEYGYEELGPGHLRVLACVPYPDDLVYGLLYGMLRHHLPPQTYFTVAYDDSTPRRSQGGEVTAFDLHWQ
ncbi:MAG TPA: hypothetical protein PKD09_19525 [Aggregatilinea sp.]|jgi:hypothetical protein|uniref:hypothetical protein n=1 Tax=Aggregatilinea sp. TaxID=2806333 RepID=UPI002C88C2B3|nr:hypothetical protein [Aggregatilinea sp.]HML23856.1 hypothetical protein [Aggregatilinea sp.]